MLYYKKCMNSLQVPTNCNNDNDTVANLSTLGLAYKEFEYKQHPAVTSIFLCIKIIDRSVKKFGYNTHPLKRSSFFFIFLLIVSVTQCSFPG